MTESTVYIIDDDLAVRSAITDLLESVGMRSEAYESGRDFMTVHRSAPSPGCMILDVRFPGSSGLDFQRELAAVNLDIPIVFITGHGDIPMSVQAMKAGAVDFLAKPFREQELLDAINRAMERDRLRRAKRDEVAELNGRFQELTARERDVLLLVIQGLLNKQIATKLGASETTVKLHRAQVMRKMQADNLPDLVRMAERLSLPPKSIS